MATDDDTDKPATAQLSASELLFTAENGLRDAARAYDKAMSPGGVGGRAALSSLKQAARDYSAIEQAIDDRTAIVRGSLPDDLLARLES